MSPAPERLAETLLDGNCEPAISACAHDPLLLESVSRAVLAGLGRVW
jgi:hypothetical protein